MMLRRACLLMALAVLLVGTRAVKAQTPNDTEKAKVLFQDAMRH